MPACASLLSGMETSPSQGVEVLVLADQDFEDMFLADTWARLGRGTLREHQDNKTIQKHGLKWIETA